MAVIKPFRALYPDPAVAHLVASVPYDVVSRGEAEMFSKDNPLSFLRVTRSEIEMSGHVDPYSKEVYQKAKENLERLKISAPLRQEDVGKFYIYRLIMNGRPQTGIAATFSVEDYNKDVILKHEKTRKIKEDDRTNHIITTEAQTGPVFLTYHGVDEINEVVELTMKNTKPLFDFTAKDRIRHTIWIMPDDYKDIIDFEIGNVKNLYIADGHHRAASASRVQRVLKENSVTHTGDEEYNYFLAVLFPAEQLEILPYNRAVFKLSNYTNESFLKKVSENFSIEETNNPIPPAKGSFAMYLGSKWYLLKPNNNVVPGESIGEHLDVSILQKFLLKPVLGIEDPRTDSNIDFIGGIRGTEELEKIVNSGKGQAAFSMYPVNVEDLIKISDAGEIMPPKSTWFEPKLRDGLLVHLI
ncbi:MAG: DUF1015 family protein [bacterium]